MRLTSSYHILYSVIIMGSYSRNILIGSLVGLIGIGICIAIELRWRKMRPVPSDRRLPQGRATTSQTNKNNNERLPLNDTPEHRASINNLLKIGFAKETEDDVTILFGPISNISIQEKSSPGLGRMEIDQKTMISFKIEDDAPTDEGDSIENMELSATLSSELQSEIENDSWNIKTVEYKKMNISNFNEEIQSPKETIEASENPCICASTPIMEEDCMSNTAVDKYDDSVREKNDVPVLCILNSNSPLTESETKTIHEDTQSSHCQYRNDKESPIQSKHSIVDNLYLIEDCVNPKADEKPVCPVPEDPMDHSSIFHNAIQCSEEPTDDTSIPSSFNSDPSESFVANVETEDFKISVNTNEGTAQNVLSTSTFAEDNISDKHSELQNSSLQVMNGIVDDKNGVLSGIGDGLRFSLPEETRTAHSVKESLEEACASISSVSHTPRNLERESTSETVNKETVKCEIKTSPNRTALKSSLSYAAMAAVPKKAKIKFNVGSKEENGIPVDSDKYDIPQTPKNHNKHRVRKLVYLPYLDANQHLRKKYSREKSSMQ
ncbi:unnamed protein product [Nezara viridula]|uniref:Uncharacterized protein n=1 Tax=Nezara viridula TaxID=85310 RepID=A0A9P0HAK1_NEZVI|nr:unnamed protein product [Nezara viridula]